MAENVSAAPTAPDGTPNLRAMVPDLIIDGALPAIAYQVLTRYGVAVVPALTAGAIFPVANIVRKFIVTRSLDLIGAIVLVFLAIGVVSSLLSGNVLFVLVKESFITGLVGLLFLSSLLWKRPIIFYVARQVMEAEGAERLAWWNRRWEHRALPPHDARHDHRMGRRLRPRSGHSGGVRADADARHRRDSVADHGNRHHHRSDSLDAQIWSDRAGARGPRRRDCHRRASMTDHFAI